MKEEKTTNFANLTQSPEVLGAFLSSLPVLEGPWDEEFHRRYCDGCTRADCDGGEGCPHSEQRNNPLWWLKLGGGRMKLLIGGSPCTHWSIAQTKNRETTASGIGWELFQNYRIARDKFKPDFFLYENNKSMSPAIRAQITAELGVEPVCINSALVSAQNRQRLYWVGKREPDGTYSQVPVEQPEDRGILLRDILETGFPLREKGYALMARHSATAEDAIARRQRNVAAEPVAIKPLTEKEMAYMVRETKDGRNHFDFDYFHDATKDKSACVTANTHKGVPYNVLTEPVRIGTIENDAKNQDYDSQQYRVYSPDGKSVTLCGNGGGLGAKTGLYAVPVAEQDVCCVAQRGRYIGENGSVAQHFEARDDGKTNTLTTVQKDNMIAVPVRVGTMPNKDGELGTSQSRCIYSTDGKSVSLQARPNGGGADGAATGLYAVPAGMAWRGRENGSAFEMRDDQKSNAVAATGHQSRLVIEAADGKQIPVYEVRGGRITIKGKTYPIKLADGFYIIRKLTVTECKRLQTVPDTYAFPVSDTQAYKMLGNGWTVDVIAHIMSHFEGLTAEPVEVFSMYDGMSCGRLALNKLGVNVTTYYATEIDKYAIQTTQHNFPETIQLGDAFQVREEDWRP